MMKMNKFEQTRALSARALQISDGAQVYTESEGETNTFNLAEKEFAEGKTPLKVIKTKKIR